MTSPRVLTLLLTASLLIVGCNGTAAPHDNDNDREPDVPGDVINERIESEEHDFRLVRVASGLEHPWSFAWLPDGGILVTERPGRLLLLDGDERSEIDGLPEIHAQGQGGLLDVVVHPDYGANGWIYYSYSSPCSDGNSATAIDRARLDGTTLVDRETIYTQAPCVSPGRHYGSRIVFPRDGTLIFSIGDRGQQNRAQDPADPSGSTLRINDDGSIPQDNPSWDEEGAVAVLYSMGNRNIQGMTIHPQTGDVWATEHGPQGGDEVNVIEGGLNYGWPVQTYGVQYRSGEQIGDPQVEGMEPPIIEWTPSIAPSGLTFYDGDAFSGWRGNLFAGALAFQQIRRLVVDGHSITHQEVLLRNEVGRIRDVRTGPDGYIYFVTDDSSGSLYRMEPVPATE